MNSSHKTFPWLLAGGAVITALLLGAAFLLAGLKPRPVQSYGDVTDFEVTNQAGGLVTLADLKGRVWVADIIFTRCPGPCFRMTQQMKELEKALPAGSGARLVSLTTDPEFDTPAVLTQYAERFEADTNRWMFLTGTKRQIGELALNGLKLAAVEKAPEERESEEDLFIHSTVLVVVDKQGRLRGIFETGGEGVEWSKSKAGVLDLVQQLERER